MRASALLAALLCVLGAAAGAEPVDWVDPLVDTHDPRWLYFSSACRPFGMVNLSPDTKTDGTWSSGYVYGRERVRCFSHIHAWQLSGIAVMPLTGEMTGHLGMDAYESPFSHDNEAVRPGYHKVTLSRYGVTAELTSTTRAGFHRYTYPETEDAYVIFDLCALLGHGPAVRAEARRVSAREIEGMSLMEGTRRRKKHVPVHFVARFNQPMTDFGGWKDGEGDTPDMVDAEAIEGRGAGAFARFSTTAENPLLMKVGISYTSAAGARKNLEAELDHWSFDRVVRESREEWNACLGRIEVQGGTDAQKTKFYTDLWHALLGRRMVSDADGAYMDMTGRKPVVRRVPLGEDGEPRFAMHNFDALWGTHWNITILWPLLCPKRYSALCNTLVEMYKNGGLIPRGPSGGNYTFVMLGDTAAPFLASAYAKGIRDFDAGLALEGLVKNTGPTGSRYYGGYASRPNPKAWEEYTTKGYISLANNLEGFHGEAVSSMTLYNAYHDWCIAEFAEGLGREEVARRFRPGASNYRNVIWPEKQSAWYRTGDGEWGPGFNPSDDVFEQKGFCECNAAIATFYVPHAPMGLAALLGGAAATAKLLERHFEASRADAFCARGKSHAAALVDYGNQDSGGKAHFFNRLGYPWLSQKWVRAVQAAALSGAGPYGGYNGDEDQGQIGGLSALMALGLFQLDGGAGRNPMYDITAPLFDKVTIHLDPEYYEGGTFTIVARRQARENVYIQSATWNGTPWRKSLLPHSELVTGGVLELELGPAPNKAWGSLDPQPPG